jgi:D-glutamate cyclase-like protein
MAGLHRAKRASALPDLRHDPIDHLLALDPGRRGIGSFFQAGGARRAAEALRRSRRVVITTGFLVEPGMPETDGPPGAAVLGRALRTLGADVRYLTDAATAPVLAATLAALGEPDKVAIYQGRPGEARAVLSQERPTHLVAIERPGRGKAGDYLNARGVSVAAWNVPIDELFVTRSRVTTVGVGDGGNEIGMGNVRTRLARGGGLLARVASVGRVDHLVVAGVSNWGAYGIVAHLGRLAGRPLVHTPADERRMVQACVAAGGCDGITRRREPTVDALPLETHEAVVALLGVSWSA